MRAADGSVLAIVEARDATPEQLAIHEVNSGIYAFDAAALGGALTRLTRDNAQGEEYLTDVVGLLRADGLVVAAYRTDDADEVLGVNDRVQLADAGGVLRERAVETVAAPASPSSTRPRPGSDRTSSSSRTSSCCPASSCTAARSSGPAPGSAPRSP